MPIDDIAALLDLVLYGIKQLHQISTNGQPKLRTQYMPQPCHRQKPTLSSSTIQLLNSSSYPSWQSLSLTIWLTDRCFKPVLSASNSQCVVLPTPGVPVTMRLGWVRAMVVFRVEPLPFVKLCTARNTADQCDVVGGCDVCTFVEYTPTPWLAG